MSKQNMPSDLALRTSGRIKSECTGVAFAWKHAASIIDEAIEIALSAERARRIKAEGVVDAELSEHMDGREFLLAVKYRAQYPRVEKERK